MKAKAKRKARVGQPFDDFLKQEGMQEEVHAAAIKLSHCLAIDRGHESETYLEIGDGSSHEHESEPAESTLDPNVEAVELQTLVRRRTC